MCIAGPIHKNAKFQQYWFPKEESKTMNYFIRSVISSLGLVVLGFLPNEMRQLYVVEALPLGQIRVKSGLNHFSPPMSCATLRQSLLTLGKLICYFLFSEPQFLHLQNGMSSVFFTGLQ